jgi:hypothetical protein
MYLKIIYYPKRFFVCVIISERIKTYINLVSQTKRKRIASYDMN